MSLKGRERLLVLKKPDREELQRLADSLLLSLDDEQMELLDREFSAVVAQFERLLSIDTTGVAPTDFVGIQPVGAMRLDAAEETHFTREQMANNTASLLFNGLLTVGKK